MDELDVDAITVDHSAATPPFEQVRAHIAARIASGALAPGTKLPTVRRLATDLQLATNTAARVYRELEADGLIVTHGRRGTFVNSRFTEAGADSDLACRAREATVSFVKEVRALGLTRAEATQLVERCWADT